MPPAFELCVRDRRRQQAASATLATRPAPLSIWVLVWALVPKSKICHSLDSDCTIDARVIMMNG